MKLQPVLRVGRIDRQIDRSGLDHTERGDHQFGRAVEQHRDAVLGADALRDQPVREPVRRFVDLAVGVVAAFVDHRDRVRRTGDLRFHQRGQCRCGRREFLTGRHPPQPVGVGGTHQVEFADRLVGVGQGAVQQHRIVLQQLPGQCRIENLDEVFGLDLDPGVAELDHESQRQLGELGAQVGALAGDARRVEALAVGAARTEGHPGHPLRAVTTVGVELAHHPVDVDALMRERADRGVAGLREHLTEGLTALRAQAHRDRVAVVPDDVLEVCGAVEHRCGDQEVVGMGVPVDQHAEGGEQHHVRCRAGVLGQRRHPIDRRIGQLQRGARRPPVRRYRRAVGPRKLQRLGRSAITVRQ